MKGQILIIDDNPMDIKIASSVIERSGFACHGFTDYLLAIEWLNQSTPQLIFLDLQMPQTTGYEVILILKKMESLADVPIIIISGKNQTDDIMKAIKLGAVDYVVKPLDPLILQEKIEKTCAKYGAEFHSVNIGDETGVKAYISKPIRVVSYSEFGVTILAEARIESGDIIEITSLPLDLFGIANLLLRCLTCVEEVKGKSFLIQMTYVGMTESQRQVIRKSCRQVWLQTKNKRSG
jgi:CheY-like chemotaxis protein